GSGRAAVMSTRWDRKQSVTCFATGSRTELGIKVSMKDGKAYLVLTHLRCDQPEGPWPAWAELALPVRAVTDLAAMVGVWRGAGEAGGGGASTCAESGA